MFLFKNSPELLKVEKATVNCHPNPYFSLLAQREHIYILNMQISFRELGVLVVKRQGRLKNHIFLSKVIFSIPENEISNSVKVFLVLILFLYRFFDKKLMIPQVLLVQLQCVLTYFK